MLTISASANDGAAGKGAGQLISAKKKRTTSIAEVTAEKVVVRGFDLGTELIGHTTMAEYFYILLTGIRPTAEQAQILDACVVALAEHGLVPSVQAARMTYASAPEALHGAVAAGLLGCGSVILGSSEATGEALQAILFASDSQRVSIEDSARDFVASSKAAGLSVPGVGHPIHRVVDPRAQPLLALAERLGIAGRHVEALTAMVAAVPAVYGRAFALNVSGVIPAVLLDAGFPLGAMKGIPLIGRTMSLVTHLLEEKANPIGFALSDAAEQAIDYTEQA